MGLFDDDDGGWYATEDWNCNGKIDSDDDIFEMMMDDEIEEYENDLRRKYKKQNRQAGKQSGGCYIATCVYGSYDCPEVWTLRRFRDNILAQHLFGRSFIRIYYAVSPTLVRMFGSQTVFHRFWRPKLDRLVRHLEERGIENTPYNDR